MIIDEEVDAFLEHFGVKGMHWGVRRSIRKASMKELKIIKKSNKTGEKIARQDPTFEREVEATKKGLGISGGTNAQKTPVGGLLTGRILGNFKNSKGQKVSEDFANAVLSKSISKSVRIERAKTGATFALGLLGIYGGIRSIRLARASRPRRQF